MGNKYPYFKTKIEYITDKQMPHKKKKRRMYQRNNDDDDIYGRITISFVNLFVMGFSTYAFYKAFTIEDNLLKILCIIIGILICCVNAVINNNKEK